MSLACLSSNPAWPPFWLRQQPKYAQKLQEPEFARLFFRAFHEVAVTRTQNMMAGIKAYQSSSIRRDAAMNQQPVVWQQGTTRLLDYNPEGGTPILVVPSLINRYDILDLDADHSFLRFLAAEGFRPYTIDWGEPGPEEKLLSVSGYITERLVPILDFLTARHGPVHLIGYCMGGLLALALALLRQEAVRSLSLFATPWHTGLTTVDDTTGTQKVLLATGEEFLRLLAVLETPLQRLDYLPVPILQVLFACLQPSYAMKKFAAFGQKDPESAEARRFVLTEDWLNDGIPLTPGVTRELMGEIYGKNMTGKLQWEVAGHLIDPRLFAKPAYIVVAGRDKIVPRESALPLARLMKGATLVEPPLGHVALMASSRAPEAVWAPFVTWLSSL